MEMKMALVYVAGYVTRNDVEYSEEEMLEVTNFYAARYGMYISELDRGNLKIPEDKACQWTFLSFIMFSVLKQRVCRTSLVKVLLEISDFFDFDMKEKHARVLSNIFLNNLCKALTPRDNKEANQKVLKLSVD